jgi:hypothetical protein
MSVSGSWTLILKTPVGDQTMKVVLEEDNGTLVGTVEDDRNPTAPIREGRVEGDQVEWKFDIKKPFAVTVTITGRVDGDSMVGTGKAGMFPAAAMTGTRG